MPILVIHAGGTIGMARSSTGFAPQRGVVEAELERLSAAGKLSAPVEVVALDPAIDSANATPGDWNRIAAALAERYEDWDGFVITHGTDTLAYTAAALCFALEGLAKPVILTGAMLPLTEPGSDGSRNLIDAVAMASAGPRGVWVQFAGRLLHGARVYKTHSHSFEAFAANPGGVPPFRPGTGLTLHTYIEPSVAILPVAPGASGDVFDFAMTRCDGVVLRCYGSGTVPETPQLAAALATARERDIPVMAVSQCPEGGIALGTYSADRLLIDSGVVDGRDLTVEAAYVKLVLALSAKDRSETQDTLFRALCGECS